MRYLYRAYSQPPADGENIPLRKTRSVRWGAFWRGSVYVNPIEDAIGYVSDLTRRFSLFKALSNATLTIKFTEEAIVVEQFDDEPLVYQYSEISGLVFHYVYFGQHSEHRKNYFIIKTKGRETEYHYILHQGRLENICKFLLDKRIPFKEYLNGSRAHLGRQDLSYREIQELKKKYGLVW